MEVVGGDCRAAKIRNRQRVVDVQRAPFRQRPASRDPNIHAPRRIFWNSVLEESAVRLQLQLLCPEHISSGHLCRCKIVAIVSKRTLSTLNPMSLRIPIAKNNQVPGYPVRQVEVQKLVEAPTERPD